MNSSVFWRHWRPDVKMYAAGNSTDYLKLGQPKFILYRGRSETSSDNHSSLMRFRCWKAPHKAMKRRKTSIWKKRGAEKRKYIQEKQTFPANASQGLMLCLNSYPYGEKHYNPWKLSHSCSHDIFPSTVTFWQGLWQVTSVPILAFLLQAAALMVGHTKPSQAAWSRADSLRPKQGSEMGLLNRKQTNKTKPKESEPWILSVSSCCCQEPGCNKAPRAQMKCLGIPMHNALNSFLLCLVVMNLLHINIS